MDTMKLLLGATIALLLGALAVSWQTMNTGVKNTPQEELARMKKQIKELQDDQDKLKLERQRQKLLELTPPPISNAAEIAAMKLQVEQNKRALEEIEAAKAKAAGKKADIDEDGVLAVRDIEGKDAELKRATRISRALLIGRVKEIVEDAPSGGFITFEVLMPEQVQTGTILAIRRKTGILGQLKVSDVTPEGAIANPMAGFGPIKPQVGDELILPPQY